MIVPNTLPTVCLLSFFGGDEADDPPLIEERTVIVAWQLRRHEKDLHGDDPEIAGGATPYTIDGSEGQVYCVEQRFSPTDVVYLFPMETSFDRLEDARAYAMKRLREIAAIEKKRAARTVRSKEG